MLSRTLLRNASAHARRTFTDSSATLAPEAKKLVDELEIVSQRLKEKPEPTSNSHMFVGPPMGLNAETHRQQRELEFEFASWVQETYGLPVGEVRQMSHRNPKTGLKATTDYMRAVHEYIGLPDTTRLFKLPGGAHIAQTAVVANVFDPNKVTFVDTAQNGKGHFRNTWAKDLENRYKKVGKGHNLVFAKQDGVIPSSEELKRMNVSQILGVGNETTSATTYNDEDMQNLLEFAKATPDNVVVVDTTSGMGSKKMPSEFHETIGTFFSVIKALGGQAGIAMVSLPPNILKHVERTQEEFDVDTGFRLATASSGDRNRRTFDNSPSYDARKDEMGPVINTDDIIAIMRSKWGLRQIEQSIGSIRALETRSENNLIALTDAVKEHPSLKFSVEDTTRRSPSVALLAYNNPDLTDKERSRVTQIARDVLGLEGTTKPDGTHVPGLGLAIDTGPYPGTPGDFRFWIGGVRPNLDIKKIPDILNHGLDHGLQTVLAEKLKKEHGIKSPPTPANTNSKHVASAASRDLSKETVTGLIVDPVALGKAPTEAKEYAKSLGWTWHDGPIPKNIGPGIHVSYQPDISPKQIAEQPHGFVIAAAKLVPANAKFPEGGARMGAGTNNMQSESFGKDSPLTNTPGQNSATTAEIWMQAVLDSRMNLKQAHEEVQAGVANSLDLSDKAKDGITGQTVAILGVTGNIGHEVAKRAKAMGMNVVGWGRSLTPEQADIMGIQYAETIGDAVAEADIVTPHVSLGDATEGIIGEEVFSKMKGATVINFGRPELVDPRAAEKFLSKNPDSQLITDGDIFYTKGPLAEFVYLADLYETQVTNFQHVAADCDHPTRVKAFQQAANQMNNAIRNGAVTNVVGPLPGGYIDLGTQKPQGIGQVSTAEVQSVVTEQKVAMAQAVQTIQAILGDGKGKEGPLSPEDCRDFLEATAQFTNTTRTLTGRMPGQGLSK